MAQERDKDLVKEYKGDERQSKEMRFFISTSPEEMEGGIRTTILRDFLDMIDILHVCYVTVISRLKMEVQS